jgi:hypothetical protein
MKDAMRSMPEWTASDKMLTDPLRRPTMTLRITRVVLETIDIKAAALLESLSINIAFSFFPISRDMLDDMKYYILTLASTADVSSEKDYLFAKNPVEHYVPQDSYLLPI